MKKLIKFNLSKICIIIGVSLIIVSVLLLSVLQGNIYFSVIKRQEYVKTIQSLIPTTHGSVLEEQNNNSMSVLSLEGVDFVGLLAMPKFNSVLPVGAQWGKSIKYPCKFNGSIYDRTIQIGATTQKGQYDFYHEISVGDDVLFTDMVGKVYSYEISNIRYDTHIDQTSLTASNSDLTLFIKNIFDFNYIIISCCNLK